MVVTISSGVKSSALIEHRLNRNACPADHPGAGYLPRDAFDIGTQVPVDHGSSNPAAHQGKAHPKAARGHPPKLEGMGRSATENPPMERDVKPRAA